MHPVTGSFLLVTGVTARVTFILAVVFAAN